MSIEDIEYLAPEVKRLWLQNERFRQAQARLKGVCVRFALNHAGVSLRNGYVMALLRLVEDGAIQPRHVKYLTGLTHSAYNQRARIAGIGISKNHSRAAKVRQPVPGLFLKSK